MSIVCVSVILFSKKRWQKWMEDPKHCIKNYILPSGSDNKIVSGCWWKYTMSNISQYKGLLVVVLASSKYGWYVKEGICG